MTPDHPARTDRLAAEYVLGTLRGLARRRFERWRERSPAVNERCRFWESRLSALATQTKPVRPPSHLWPQIQARLNLTSPPSARRAAPRWAALAAGIVAVAILAGILWREGVFEGKPQTVASISEPSGAEHWAIEIRGEKLSVRAETLPQQPAGKVFELWALRSGGATPVSLGVLPSDGKSVRTLTADQQMALAASSTLAVSIEPTGGSPTGLPTGPVVYTAPLHSPG